MGSSPTRGSSFFLGKVTALGVLCCFALFVCLILLASFFLPSHLSFKNMYMCWVCCVALPFCLFAFFFFFFSSHLTCMYSVHYVYMDTHLHSYVLLFLLCSELFIASKEDWHKIRGTCTCTMYIHIHVP